MFINRTKGKDPVCERLWCYGINTAQHVLDLELENPWTVTPLAGVWIEISVFFNFYADDEVTPLAGVWIEIEKEDVCGTMHQGHSSCGSVD